MRLFGRVGIALTVVAAFVQFVAVVTRGLAADPVRVPWGNMYEFTLTGTLVVVVGYLLLYNRYSLSWLSPVVTGFVLVVLMVDVLVLYTPVVAAARRAAVALAGDPRGRRDHRDRRLHPRRHVLGALPGQGALGAAPRAGRAGGYLARLPELAVLDRVAYRTHAFAFPIWTFAALIAGPDLGALRLGPLLGLGPQGGVGVHHLGGVRRLPARPRHVGLEGPLGRARRPGRPGHAVVQLRRDQLLLRQRQPALVRRPGVVRSAP